MNLNKSDFLKMYQVLLALPVKCGSVLDVNSKACYYGVGCPLKIKQLLFLHQGYPKPMGLQRRLVWNQNRNFSFLVEFTYFLSLAFPIQWVL